jgi:glucose-6-phosphate 1-dehydrogenase
MSQVSGGDEAWAAHYSEEAAPPGALGPPGTALVILGAGGDLSKKKTYPALLLLYRRGMLPASTRIWGVDRLEMSTSSFRDKMAGHGFLHKAVAGDTDMVESFLQLCHYKQAQVDSRDDFSQLNAEICAWMPCTNRVFYLALPPAVFHAAVTSIKGVAMAEHGDNGGRKPWTRVIVEKPFGKDLNSFEGLQSKLGKLLTEEQVYRIDHYLGKEMVQNLLVVRFANAMFEPMWNRHHIASVSVTFKEDITVEGRAGYFDGIGLIRDVMQNHLLQLVTLVAMEPPTSMNSEEVRDKKVDVLRAMKPLTLDDVVLGQYEGYSFDDDVPSGSTTETFAQAVFAIENSRWRGVPFIVKCAKAVNERKCEIRVQFEESPLPYYRDQCAECGQVVCPDECTARQGANRNEMVIRVQPDEAMYMKTNMKKVRCPNTLVEAAGLFSRFDL